MSKEIWKPGNMIFPLPAVLVTVSDNEGNDNVLTVAWTGTICTNPAMAYVSIRPSRHSYKMIKETGEFVKKITKFYFDFHWEWEHIIGCVINVKSGRDVDKFKEAHLTKEKAQYVKAPLIKESPVNIECKVVDVKECGSHDMFIANVLAVHADKEYMDKDGRFQLEKANPIVYSHGHYYSLGQNLGRFGYSVMKKKRKKSANKKKRLENKR